MAICLAGMDDLILSPIVLILAAAVLYGYYDLYHHAYIFVFDEEKRKRMISKWKRRRK